MSINFIARETFLFLALFLALSIDGQDHKVPDLQSVCLSENIQNSPHIPIDLTCSIFQVSNCVFNGLTGSAIDVHLTNSYTMTKDVRLQINDNSFTNCATTGQQNQIAAIYIVYEASIHYKFLPNTDYIVSSCSFTGCAQSVYISSANLDHVFPLKYLTTENQCKLIIPSSPWDQIAINLNAGDSGEIVDCSNLNFTNSRNTFYNFIYIRSHVALSYVNINNINTNNLLIVVVYAVIFNCINIHSITIDQSGTDRSIIKSESDLMIQNVLIINIENVDNSYLCYQNTDASKVTFQNCFTTMPISRVSNSEYKGSITFVKNLARLTYSDYGCQFGIEPTEKFTESSKLTESHTFSKSMQFKKSIIFSPSTKFTKSQAFSSSSRFSSSKQFSPSSNFSPSDMFTKSSIFIASRGFTYSINFSPSSNFPPTASFTPSNVFTPSDSKYVYFLRQSRLAGLPSKTSQYGSLSTTEVATISTSVIIGIIIVGVILMIFYIRERSKAMVDIELPDLLSIPSDSSETTEDCVISFSYSLESRTRENDPFTMDPEYYLNLRD